MKLEDQGEVVYEDRDCVVRVKKGQAQDLGLVKPTCAVYVNAKTPRGEEVVSRRAVIGANYLLWNYRAL